MTVVPIPSRTGLAALILLMLACAAGWPVPLQAQGRAASLAADLCLRPPMDAVGRDRLRRRADFALVLDVLADRCPDVAMVFLEFEVGSIDGRAAGAGGAILPPFGWLNGGAWAYDR